MIKISKILLAVGHIGLEDYIKESLKDEFEFVGESVHRENVLNLIKETAPDILVIRETLPGKTNILNLVYGVRAHFEKVRVIFLAGERAVGDPLLSNLVNYGIYDIIHKGNLLADDIVQLIENPNNYQDVKHLQPLPDMDEDYSELEFVMPGEEEEEEEEEDHSDVSEEDDSNIEFIIPEESNFKDLESQRRSRLRDESQYDKNKEEDEEVPEVKRERRKVNIPKINMPKIVIPRIENPFEFEKRDPMTKRSRRDKDLVTKVSKEKIITFWGAKSGVGTTTIAHNMAMSLASDGNKVIYIELDDSRPSVAYWYDLGLLDKGIETFLENLESKEYRGIRESIIKTEDLKHEDKKTYRQFPEKLDFLFFSNEYLAGMKERSYEGSLKDLYMYLLYQEGYDFVILDVASNVKKKDLADMLMFSSLIFIVVSQDVSSLGYHTLELDNLKKEGINIKNKSHYIINNYIDIELNTKKIREWLEVDTITSIPSNREVYLKATLNKNPAIMDRQGGIVLRTKLDELKKII